MVGFKDKNVTYIPTSAFLGLNLTTRSRELSWYEGPCLTEALRELKDAKQHLDKDLIMVQVGIVKQAGRDRYPLLQVV